LYLAQGRAGAEGAFTLRVLAGDGPSLSERDVVVLTDALDRLRGLQHPRLTRLVAFDLSTPSPLCLHTRPDTPSLRECIDAGRLPSPRGLTRALAHVADAVEYVQRTLGPRAQRSLLPEELLVDGDLGWLDGAGILGAFLAAGRLPESAAAVLDVGYLVPGPWWEGDPGRACVFSLASTAFEALTGQLPFGRAGPAGLLAELRSGTLPTVSAWCPAMPAAVDQVFARAWRLEGDGFDHPTTFVKALRGALEEPSRPPLRSGVHALGDGYHDDPDLVPTTEVPAALLPRAPSPGDGASGTAEVPPANAADAPPLAVQSPAAKLLPLRSARIAGPVRSYDPSWEMLGVESSPPPEPTAGTRPRLRDDRTPEVSYDLASLRTDHPVLSSHAEALAPTSPSAPDITLELPDTTPELSDLRLADVVLAPEDPRPLFGALASVTLAPALVSAPPLVSAPAPPVARTPAPPALRVTPSPEVPRAPAPSARAAPAPELPMAPQGVATHSGAWRAVRAGAFERTTLRVSRVLGLSTVLSAIVAAALLIQATRSLDGYRAELARARRGSIAAAPRPVTVAPTASPTPTGASVVVVGAAPVLAVAPRAQPVARPPAPAVPTAPAVAPGPVRAPAAAGPSEAARQRVIAALRQRVNDCVEGMEERRVVVDVTYEGVTGAAQRVRPHAPFSAAPLGPCLQAAVRSARVGAFPAATWDTRLVFPITRPAWLRQAP
jgi:hypothetical protein